MRATAAVLCGLGCLAAAPAIAGPVTFATDPGGQVTFIMPSGNVACIYTPPGGTAVYVPADGGPELSCDRAEPTYLRFTLAASGPAEVLGDVGDASCCGGTNTFAYGSTWSLPPFTCAASSAGLDCQRGANGFFIAKAKISAY